MNAFTARIDEALRRHRDRTAFVQEDLRLTCSDVDERVEALRAWIRRRCNGRPGERIAALTGNQVEAVLLEWATYRADCIWLGIPARERDVGSLARLLADFTPRLLVLERSGPYEEMLFDPEDFPADEIPPPPGIAADRFRTLRRRGRARSVEFRAAGEPIRRLRYSSGSSGEPKAIAYTDRTLSVMLDMISKKVLEGRPWTVVHGLPITWASGSLVAPALCCGGKNVILDSWSAGRFTQAVAEEKKVLSLLTPRLLAVLVRSYRDHGAGWETGLRRVLLAGGPTPVRIMRHAWELFSKHTEFIVTLGQTEASFPITWHRVRWQDLEGDEGRAAVPLGRFTDGYRGSGIDPDSREILLRGDAVAPARWVPPRGHVPGRFEGLPERRGCHRTGDRAVQVGRLLHYLGRVSDSWSGDAGFPPAEAVEALLDGCPGVHRSRIDRMGEVDGTIAAEVTLKPEADSLRISRVQAFFDEHKRDARLGAVTLARVRIGEVEMTMSGKVKRPRAPNPALEPEPGASPRPASCACGPRPSSGSPGAIGPLGSTRWQEFDFSRIASGPLYFYVGSGLSAGAGLVRWSEMASLIWTYCERFEKRSHSKCPRDCPKEIEEFLDDFVREVIDASVSKPVRILARPRAGGDRDPRALGRVALLNMLLRYRAPRARLVPAGDRAVVVEDGSRRERPGEEPGQEDLVVHSMIWRSRCHGVFTTNYDMLLEHAHSSFHHGAALRTYRYNADFLPFILSNPHFVLKLHGDINDIATMEFCPDKAWSRGRLAGPRGRGRDLEHAYCAALARGHMIYLGCGFRDATIRRLHRCWQKRTNPGAPHCRIALLPRWELTPAKTAEEIRRTPKRGIELLSFDEFSEVREFMQEVVAARSGVRERRIACLEASDLHHQLFQAPDPTRAVARFSTEPWSCRGLVRRPRKDGRSPRAPA